MTKGISRRARLGETPFDLLQAVLADKNDKQAMALFAEFAKGFQGQAAVVLVEWVEGPIWPGREERRGTGGRA